MGRFTEEPAVTLVAMKRTCKLGHASCAVAITLQCKTLPRTPIEQESTN